MPQQKNIRKVRQEYVYIPDTVASLTVVSVETGALIGEFRGVRFASRLTLKDWAIVSLQYLQNRQMHRDSDGFTIISYNGFNIVEKGAVRGFKICEVHNENWGANQSYPDSFIGCSFESHKFPPEPTSVATPTHGCPSYCIANDDVASIEDSISNNQSIDISKGKFQRMVPLFGNNVSPTEFAALSGSSKCFEYLVDKFYDSKISAELFSYVVASRKIEFINSIIKSRKLEEFEFIPDKVINVLFGGLLGNTVILKSHSGEINGFEEIGKLLADNYQVSEYSKDSVPKMVDFFKSCGRRSVTYNAKSDDFEVIPSRQTLNSKFKPISIIFNSKLFSPWFMSRVGDTQFNRVDPATTTIFYLTGLPKKDYWKQVIDNNPGQVFDCHGRVSGIYRSSTAWNISRIIFSLPDNQISDEIRAFGPGAGRIVENFNRTYKLLNSAARGVSPSEASQWESGIERIKKLGNV